MQFQFDTLADFFAMGGYGFYVWLSYGITFLSVIALVWQSKREIKQTLKQARKEQRKGQQLNKNR